MAMRGVFPGNDTTQVSYITTAVNGSVTIKGFAPFAGLGQAETIVFACDGCEIKDHRNGVSAISLLADKRENAVFVVGAVEPVEAAEVVIGAPEARLSAIK